jgi:hypothetical protein
MLLFAAYGILPSLYVYIDWHGQTERLLAARQDNFHVQDTSLNCSAVEPIPSNLVHTAFLFQKNLSMVL